MSKEQLETEQQGNKHQELITDEKFSSAEVLPPTVPSVEEKGFTNATTLSKEPQPLLDDYSTIDDILAAPSDGDGIPLHVTVKSMPLYDDITFKDTRLGEPDLSEDKPERLSEGDSDKKQIPLYSSVNLEQKTKKLNAEELKPISMPVAESALLQGEQAQCLLENVIDDITKWELELSSSQLPSPPLPPPMTYSL